MFTGHDRLLFEIGTAQQLGPPEAWQQAWLEHRATGQPFATILLRQGGVVPAVLLGAVATHLGWDYVGDLPDHLPRALLDLIPAELARMYGVVPLATRDRTITFLALDPFNQGLVNDLTFILGRDVRLAVAEPAGIQRLLEQYYGGEPESLDTALEALVAAPGTAGESEAAREELAGSTPLIRFVNLVLARGIRDGVSDIHFEPFEQEFKIRYRRDGTLYELLPPPQSLARPIISRLKVMANLDIAERRLPQDGRINLTLGGRAVDLRVSTLPTQFGESVVLRVLDPSSGRLELGELGLPEPLRRDVDEIIHRPHGIFLVTGPTGSGKTTTLYGCLKAINQPEAKLLTVEDPVEYELEGVMQVPVNLPAGLTFARALRSFLRQDPDIVMVGEIRDAETAQIALQAALTGHLVLSTLHTTDALGAVTRLLDLGIAPYLLASTLEGVLAQRLLRRLCPACKVAVRPAESLLNTLGLASRQYQDRPIMTRAGCPACRHTGYVGRLGVYELLCMTEPLREKVGGGVAHDQLREQALAGGMTSLRAAAVDALYAGLTTVEEVVKYT